MPDCLNVELRSRNDEHESFFRKIDDEGVAGIIDQKSEAAAIEALIEDPGNYDVYIGRKNVNKELNKLLGKETFGRSWASLSYDIKQLKDPDPEVRGEAIHDLVRRFPQGEKFFFYTLKNDPVGEVRKEAIHGLLERSLWVGELKNKGLKDKGQAAFLLISTLNNDKNDEVRVAAIWALQELLGRRAAPQFIKALRTDKSIEVQNTAAWALGDLEDPYAIPPLIKFLDDPDASKRARAAQLLGYFDKKPAVIKPLITTALNDSDGEVRLAAVWALYWSTKDLKDTQAMPALIHLSLTDKNAKVRERAVRSLHLFKGEPSIVEPLITVLKDPEAEVREAAVWLLGGLEDNRAVEPLIQALADLDDTVAQHAAWKLGEFSDPQVKSALLKVLKSPNTLRRASAVSGLKKQLKDPQVLQATLEALKDPKAKVRAAAVWALAFGSLERKELEDAQVVEPLRQALKDQDAEVQRGAAYVLGLPTGP